MQLKFVDHKDFDHLVNTLSLDFKPLFNKMKSIEDMSKSFVGGLNKSKSTTKSIIWISPVSKFEWQIHYNYQLNGKKFIIFFYPFTEYTSSEGEKIYISLSKENNQYIFTGNLTSNLKKDLKTNWSIPVEFLKTNNIIINVFRGHFLKQYRDRLNKDTSSYEIISEFNFNRSSFIVNAFIQNKKWLMFIHRYGVAMIMDNMSFLLFETYIPIEELKQDQIDAISNHLKVLEDETYFLTSLYLIQCKGWRDLKLIDGIRINSILEEIKRTNPNRASIIEKPLRDYLLKVSEETK